MLPWYPDPSAEIRQRRGRVWNGSAARENTPNSPKLHFDAHIAPIILPVISQDFNILFLFSFLFNRSTRFLCIVSANFSYRAFSSFAARLSLIACILLYLSVSCERAPALQGHLFQH